MNRAREEEVVVRELVSSINQKAGKNILFWVTCPYCEKGYTGFLTVNQTVECSQCGNRFLVEARKSGPGKVVQK